MNPEQLHMTYPVVFVLQMTGSHVLSMQKRLLPVYVCIGFEGRLLHGVQDHLQAVQITSESQQLNI